MPAATIRALGVELHADDSAFDDVREAWQGIEAAGGAFTFFQSWSWNRLWWKHFGGRARLHILSFTDAGRTVGIAPCFVSGGPATAIRWLGTGNSDYLGLLALLGREAEVVRAFTEYLEREAPARIVDLHQIPDGTPLADRLAPNCTEQATTVRLDLPRSWDRYQVTLTGKVRSNIRRAWRDLDATGGARVRLAGPDEVGGMMDRLFRLHGRRWRARGLPGSFVGRKVREFHKEWACAVADEGLLRLSLLELGGQAAAALYGVRYGGSYSYFQAGFDPAVSRFSPGTVLVAEAIRSAIEEGCATFDFLRGEEWYKTRWKPQRIQPNFRAVYPLNGWLGAASCHLHRRWNAVERKLRQRFEGGSLLRRPR